MAMIMMNDPIRIFVTGGTFDKEYNELTGSLYFRGTHVPEMLHLGRCRLDVTVQTLMMIDSLEMTAEGRALIAEKCRNATERRLIITHGTDTMVETAELLAQAVFKGPKDPGPGPDQDQDEDQDKTIVLTGAMVPYAFGSSDGLFNLGSALSFVQVLPRGVYVAMNGRCFPAGQVRKDRQAGIFETLTSTIAQT